MDFDRKFFCNTIYRCKGLVGLPVRCSPAYFSSEYDAAWNKFQNNDNFRLPVKFHLKKFSRFWSNSNEQFSNILQQLSFSILPPTGSIQLLTVVIVMTLILAEYLGVTFHHCDYGGTHNPRKRPKE